MPGPSMDHPPKTSLLLSSELFYPLHLWRREQRLSKLGTCWSQQQTVEPRDRPLRGGSDPLPPSIPHREP